MDKETQGKMDKVEKDREAAEEEAEVVFKAEVGKKRHHHLSSKQISQLG